MINKRKSIEFANDGGHPIYSFSLLLVTQFLLSHIIFLRNILSKLFIYKLFVCDVWVCECV